MAGMAENSERNRMTRCMTAGGSLLALLLPLAGNAHADDRLRACLEMQDKVPSAQALDCYRRAVQEHLGQTAAEERPPASHRRSLAEEWASSNELLHVYRQNYFLFSHSSKPNDAPTSPNPDNQVPGSYPLDNNEWKFQISIKAHMLGENRHTLWFGYTQLSFWQFFDHAHSQPFRENNFEPELIYAYRPEPAASQDAVQASLLKVGLVHQSNGQVLPRSRAWNRLYVQAGLERELGDDKKLVMLPRLWKRLGGGGSDDDNPDIADYLGHGDLEIRYCDGTSSLSLLARIHSLQVDLSLSLNEMTSLHNTNFHLQYFDGYGESLIDYNQRHRTLGVGFSMPFE
jgi:phospholipase A1